MFVPIKFMLEHARSGGYSISRFVVTDLESIEAVALSNHMIDDFKRVYNPDEISKLAEIISEEVTKRIKLV